MKWKGWINEILGLWLFVSVFMGFSSNVYSINDVFVGIVVMYSSFCIAHGKPWQAWVSGILGFWLVIAAFILSLVSGVGLYLNNMVAGTVIAVAGFFILKYSKKMPHHETLQEHQDFGDYGAE